ncbi:MAG: hypothetical protein HN348_07120 [Proteobacteria bacterium]|nr:hypothetical protein [Pseudomonadota bacterium]
MRATRGVPLRPTIVVFVIAMMLIAAFAVAIPLTLTNKRVVNQMWEARSLDIAHLTTQRTIRYLEPAIPHIESSERHLAEGRLNLDEPHEILSYLYAAVEANPNFTWASFGRSNGTFIAVYRNIDGQIWGTIREQEPTPGTQPQTRYRDYTRGKDRSWKLEIDETKSYDPRLRPWYQQATEAKRGLWVEPFLFSSRQQPGFSYTKPQYDVDGQLMGVWAVDYEMPQLSEFLATIEVGEQGRVYVLTAEGMVVGHPRGQVTVQSGEELQIAQAYNHVDTMLSTAWTGYRSNQQESQTFEVNDLLVMALPFPEESGLDWIVLTVVPEDDIFGEIRSRLKMTTILAVFEVLLMVLIAVFLSNKMSNVINEMARELKLVGNFQLLDRPLSNIFFREMYVMAEAAEHMKAGLRSFAKYVPWQLVQELIRSGRAAELGGDVEEASVLFSDIDGFTTIAETMEPDELVNELGEYLEAASNAIEATDGIVDKFIGDAVMAFWGSLRGVKDHALMACRSALDMHQRELADHEKRRAEGRPLFKTRIGINTGGLLVGNIGAPDRFDFTVMGDTVNFGARLESLNKEYGTHILVGPRTRELTKNEMVFRPVDRVAVKGRVTAEMVYELHGIKGQVEPDILEAIEIWSKGLQSYLKRDFAAAATAFQSTKEILGEARVKPILERCAHFTKHPPGDDWDGTVTMKRK